MIGFLERAARRRAIRNVRKISQGCVLAGPFRGMAYDVEAFGSELAPKLAGTYELELHGWVDRIVSTRYDIIHDIGSAEGYYAVGMALKLPDARILAYDRNPAARRAAERLAALNRVSERVAIETDFDAEALTRHPARRGLVFCDIEGDEQQLLDPIAIPALREADLLVEVHDGAHAAAIEGVLRSRFAATHTIERAVYRGRSAADAPELLRRRCNAATITRALDERRRVGLTWLFMTGPRSES